MVGLDARRDRSEKAGLTGFLAPTTTGNQPVLHPATIRLVQSECRPDGAQPGQRQRTRTPVVERVTVGIEALPNNPIPAPRRDPGCGMRPLRVRAGHFFPDPDPFSLKV